MLTTVNSSCPVQGKDELTVTLAVTLPASRVTLPLVTKKKTNLHTMKVKHGGSIATDSIPKNV
jgi:hypothetical protein